ncbi:MAG: rhodanese-related sulfurtransferase [Lentimonas sp.]|jgi:rhodanese-related sulfurtransferase
MNWISPTELNKALSENNDYLILDIREEYEHDICSIPCLAIPMAEIASRKNEIPKDKKIAVMCRSGKRAEAVANLMECELGFSNLLILEGGILKWIEQIAPNLEAY